MDNIQKGICGQFGIRSLRTVEEAQQSIAQDPQNHRSPNRTDLAPNPFRRPKKKTAAGRWGVVFHRWFFLLLVQKSEPKNDKGRMNGIWFNCSRIRANSKFKPCFLYYTIYYLIILYSTLLYSTLLYSTLLYSTLLYYKYHIIPYHIISHHIISCRITSQCMLYFIGLH